jgi:hypothetical protein
MASVTVRGEASASGKPDEALVSVELSAVRAGPDEAYVDVAERSETLVHVLDELEVPVEDRTTTGVTLREERDWVNGAYVHRGYQAVNRLTLRLDAPETVARLLREAVTRTDARVDGPWWRLRSDNPARLEACRRAAEAARQKCEAYAGALGMRVGALISVAEPGVARPEPRRAVAAFSADAMESSAPEIGVQPGELDVHAAVEVTYALEAE